MTSSRRVFGGIRRWSAQVLLASAGLVAAAGAARAVATVDYTAMVALTKPSAYFASCRVVVRSTDDLRVNAAAPGLAVTGGSETAIDGAEIARFHLVGGPTNQGAQSLGDVSYASAAGRPAIEAHPDVRVRDTASMASLDGDPE